LQFSLMVLGASQWLDDENVGDGMASTFDEILVSFHACVTRSGRRSGWEQSLRDIFKR
jgi:hypothetical protein